MNRLNIILFNIKFYIICLLPLSLVTGPLLSDLSIIIVGILFIILSIKNKEWHYYYHPIIILFWIWSFYLIFISLLSSKPTLSLESSLFYWRFGFFVLGVWYVLDKDSNFIKKFSIYLTIILSIVTIDGFVQYLTGFNLVGYSMLDLNTRHIGRISGFFGEELILGSYLSRLIPIFLAVIFYSFSYSKKVLFLTLLIYLSISSLIFLTGERAAFFNLVLSSIAILLFINISNKIRCIIFISFLFVITFLAITNETNRARMFDYTIYQSNLMKFLNFSKDNDNEFLIKNEIIEPGDQQSLDTENIKKDHFSLNNKIIFFSIQHQVLYKSAYKIFLDYPFFGIGPKMFREICKIPKYKVTSDWDRSIDGCSTHPHNTYVQLLAETGIVGTVPILSAFFYIVFSFLKSGYYKIILKKNLFSNFEICLFSALLITLWPLIPTGNFFNNWLNVIFFLPIGFLLYVSKRNN